MNFLCHAIHFGNHVFVRIQVGGKITLLSGVNSCKISQFSVIYQVHKLDLPTMLTEQRLGGCDQNSRH